MNQSAHYNDCCHRYCSHTVPFADGTLRLLVLAYLTDFKACVLLRELVAGRRSQQRAISQVWSLIARILDCRRDYLTKSQYILVHRFQNILHSSLRQALLVIKLSLIVSRAFFLKSENTSCALNFDRTTKLLLLNFFVHE